MPHHHRNFWLDLGGKIGVPIFAAALVGCLLSDRFEIIHGVLLAIGLGLILMQHRFEFHGGPKRES